MIWATVKLHLRIALRNGWLVGVLAVCTLLLLALSVGKVDGSGGFAYRFVEQGLIIPLFLMGQIMAVAAQSVRNESRDEAIESLPYEAGLVIGGQLLALYLVWLSAGTLLWLMGILLFVVLPGQPADPVILLGGWVRLFPVTLLFTTGVGHALAYRRRQGYGAYLLPLGILLAAIALPGSLASLGPWTSVLDITLRTFFPLTPWGVFPAGGALLWNRLFTAGVGLWAAFAVIGREAQRRGERSPGVWRGLSVATALLLVVAIVGSGLTWSRRLQTGRETGGTPTAPELGRLAANPVALSSYDLHLEMDLLGHRLHGEAVVEAEWVGRTLGFFLNRQFRVREVLGPNGTAVPFIRARDALVIEAAGVSGRYTIRYEGAVWEWREAGGYWLADHIAPQGVMLPEGTGWYPEPGSVTSPADRSMGPLGFWMVRARNTHQPVAINLSVTAPGLRFLSNADGQTPIRGAWLVGTTNDLLKAEGIQVYPVAMNQKHGEAFLQRFQGEIRFYEGLVPLAGPVQVVEVPDSSHFVRFRFFPPAEFGSLVLLPTTSLPKQRSGYWTEIIRSHLLIKWWGTARTDQEQWAYVVLASFMAAVYEQEHPGATAQLYLPGTSMQQVATARTELMAFYQAHGLEATQALLQTLRNSATPISMETVNQVLAREAVDR